MRPLIGKWVDRHRKLINITDRSSILLVVYSVFSAAIVEKLWHKIDGWSLLTILMMPLLLLVVVNTYAARWLGFDTVDEITIVFCGSKKSLANGIPMANVLFCRYGGRHGIVLPLMIFHQVQLMVCALPAQRYAGKIAKQRAILDATK